MKLSFCTINDAFMNEDIKFRFNTLKQPIFNFYSTSCYGIPLKNLAPSKEIVDKYLLNNSFENGDEMTYQFDMNYASQLFNDDNSFIDLMILLFAVNGGDINYSNEEQVSKGGDVIVLTNYSNVFMQVILDSLMKYIQQRYGIQSYIINDINDYDSLEYSEFSDIGMCNFISDTARFLYLTSKDADDLYKKYSNDYYADYEYLFKR